MTAAPRRSGTQIDPQAREIAETLARQSGLSLDEWIARLMGKEAERLEAPPHAGDMADDLAAALETLSQRLEAMESRSASMGLDETVQAALARLVEAGREQVAVAARFEGAVQEIGAEQAKLADRLRRIESETAGPRSAEALKSLEASLGRMAGHLYEGEGRTREAIDEITSRLRRFETGEAKAGLQTADGVEELARRLEAAEARTSAAFKGLNEAIAALEHRQARAEAAPSARAHADVQGGLDAMRQSVGALDARLGALEAHQGEGVSKSDIEAVAIRLGEQVADLANRIEAQAAEPTAMEGVARRLAEISQTVRQSEQRSRESIEHIGREVVEMSGALVRRVQSAERRNAEAIEQIGAEVARVSQGVDARLGRADTVQAQALEKLGDEIARISERLAERIATADRRSAQAIEEVGDQMARVTERLSQRHDRSNEDLGERIRLSEERTARVLKEAREEIESLVQARRRASDLPKGDFDEAQADLIGEDPFAGFAPPPPAPGLAEPQPFSQEDLDLADRFGAHLTAPAASADDAAPKGALEPDPPAASPWSDPFDQGPIEDTSPPVRAAPMTGDAESLTTREAVRMARAAAQAAAGGPAPARPQRLAGGEAGPLFGGGAFSARRRQAPAAPLLGFGLAAAFGLALGGFWFVQHDRRGPTHSDQASAAPTSGVAAATGAGAAEPRFAVALSPGGLRQSAAPGEDLPAVYAGAVTRLAANDPHGLDDLRRVAMLGYAPAEFYLAKLYESGTDGVGKDAALARYWTEKAAQAGEPRAMHNLALDFFEGLGGPQDGTLAAQWFAKAAAMGVVDSQYNLGRLYEEGLAVSPNLAEAYKWYLIAARSGDADSKAGAARVRAELKPAARSAAERSAAGFRPLQVSVDAAQPTSIATAQKALLGLGYYRGPADGASSPALKMAIAAFQRDNHLSPTGAPDAATLSKLALAPQ